MVTSREWQQQQQQQQQAMVGTNGGRCGKFLVCVGIPIIIAAFVLIFIFFSWSFSLQSLKECHNWANEHTQRFPCHLIGGEIQFASKSWLKLEYTVQYNASLTPWELEYRRTYIQRENDNCAGGVCGGDEVKYVPKVQRSNESNTAILELCLPSTKHILDATVDLMNMLKNTAKSFDCEIETYSIRKFEGGIQNCTPPVPTECVWMPPLPSETEREEAPNGHLALHSLGNYSLKHGISLDTSNGPLFFLMGITCSAVTSLCFIFTLCGVMVRLFLRLKPCF